MDESHADPSVGSDFKGVERFYPSQVFRDAHNAGEMILGMAKDGPLSVSKDQLDQAKGALLNRVKQINELAVLQPLARVLGQVESAIRPRPVQTLLFGE